MKRNKILVYILHRLFASLLVIISLLILVNIGFELFTDNGKVGSFSAGSHHSKGYSIPVKIKTRVYDPVFNNFKLINKKKSNNNSGLEWSYAQGVYFNDMPADINEGTKNILTFHFDDQTEFFTTNEDIFRSDGYIIAKSKNKLISFLLVVKGYLGILGLVMMLFFLERIFFRLNKKLSFSNKLYFEVKWLGLVFTLTEILRLLFSYILGTYYRYISSETLINGETLTDGIKLSMNPRLEFDLAFFMIGLSLIVLANLLKSGSQLQQENDLTV